METRKAMGNGSENEVSFPSKKRSKLRSIQAASRGRKRRWDLLRLRHRLRVDAAGAAAGAHAVEDVVLPRPDPVHGRRRRFT